MYAVQGLLALIPLGYLAVGVTSILIGGVGELVFLALLRTRIKQSEGGDSRSSTCVA